MRNCKEEQRSLCRAFLALSTVLTAVPDDFLQFNIIVDSVKNHTYRVSSYHSLTTNQRMLQLQIVY